MSRIRQLASYLLCTTAIVLCSAAHADKMEVAAADSGADSGKSAAQLEEITVVAQRTTRNARTQQLQAPNLIDIQPAEEIIKYPDFNAAEAIGRIPGVSLSSDTGEGRFVNIRGLDANLNGATLGGVVLLNTFPGGTVFGTGRAVELDTVPIGLVDRIEVTKTGLPSHEAEGLGGSVELTPRTASGIDAPFVEGTIGGGYEPLRNSFSLWRGEMTAGARFGVSSGGLNYDQGDEDRPFSIIVTASQNNDRRAVDDAEAAYADQQPGLPDKMYDTLELRRYQYHRRRFGYGGEFDYKPDPDNSWFFRYNEGGYTESVYRQRLIYSNLEFQADGSTNLTPSMYTDPSNTKGFIAPNASLTSALRDEEETHDNKVISWGGKNAIGDDGILVDYQGAYSEATFRKGFDYNSTFSSPNSVVLRYDNTTNPNFPKIQILNGVNPNDPSQYILSGFNNGQEVDKDEEWSGRVNVTVPLPIDDNDGSLKFGAQVRRRDKISIPTSQTYSVPNVSLSQVLGAGPFTYYDNNYTVGFTPSSDQVRNLFFANPGLFVENVAKDQKRNAAAFFTAQENITAGYLQYDLTLGKFSVLAGVRVENTDATYGGITTAVDANGNATFTPNTRKTNYTDPFPTFQVRYQPIPDLVARLTYSSTIGRPGFIQNSGSTQIDYGANTVTTGNPGLKATTGDNFDLSVEYYLPDSGIISLGAFDKEFQNYIVSRSEFGTFPGIVGIARIATFANAPSAQAYGMEGNYQQKFTFLPEPFDGFGVLANITVVQSSVELRPGDIRLLPATSRLTYNAALSYDKGPVSVRFAAEYVGKSLFAVGGSAATDIIQDSRLLMDVSASYQITDNFQLYFQGKNLTNQPLSYSEGNSARPIQREFYDVTLESGIRFKFGGGVMHTEENEAAYVPPPAARPAPAPPAPTSYLVFFDFNKSDLAPQAISIVDQAARNAAPMHVTELTVTGHTDTIGSDAYNLRLSRRRAESVAAELEKDGIKASEIEIVAKGKHELLVPTADGVKEPQNRRVQIVYSSGNA
ncbi:MAG: TonB-dependent receptor [Rhodospirillales bacterium]|nr:TonB-dependent receptor [Rhodospirillales bacterium]